VDPVVYLPTGDPDAFSFVFEWLYRQNVTASPELSSVQAITPAQEGTLKSIRHSNAISTLIKVYGLALLWEMTELLDLIMNQLGNLYFWSYRWPSQEEFCAAYSHTRPNCGLRKFMARSYNYILLMYHDHSRSLGDLSTTKKLVSLADNVPSLKEDSFDRLRGLMSEGSTRLLDPGLDMVCDYHTHGKQETCRFKGISFRGKPHVSPSLSSFDFFWARCYYLNISLAEWNFIVGYSNRYRLMITLISNSFMLNYQASRAS
jgi:hypothetical protein